LSRRSRHASQHALTEEATKTSVVLPLIQAFGFDPFNLEEVVPEYVADVGLKKGEKIDFALNINGVLSVLIEVKPITLSLGNAQYSQLFRYFATKEAKLAVLTNG
jgi:predicted type IV restriction endonuclease